MYSPQIESRNFLIKRKYLIPEENFCKLIVQEGSFFLYDDNFKYQRLLEDEEVEEDITRLTHEDPSFLPESSGYYIKDIVRNLKAICKVPGLRPGTFLGPNPEQASFFIPLNNLTLALDYDSSKVTCRQIPLSKYLFTTYKLPYDYNPEAKCEKFQKFLDEVLSKDEQALLQEWFGYNLIPVNYAHKFLLAVGDGANGKGVILNVLRLLLGKENVDDNTLEAFERHNRFDLASTEKMLAAIVDEVNMKRAVPSEKFKRYIAGSPVIFERKNKQGRKGIPTARWTVACNSLPMFQDLTDGIIRRVLVLYFSIQFLDESKQNKFLLEESYWNPELSGIFNWAFKGLERVILNNWKFTIPSSSLTTLRDYKLAMNPPVGFLTDYLEYSNSGEITSIDLYQAYCGYCRIYGFRVENSEVFGRYVKKEFPRASQSKNPLHRKNGRSRVWYGLAFKNDRDPLTLEAAATRLTQINGEVLSQDNFDALKKDDLRALEKAILYEPEGKNE